MIYNIGFLVWEMEKTKGNLSCYHSIVVNILKLFCKELNQNWGNLDLLKLLQCYNEIFGHIYTFAVNVGKKSDT